MKIYNKIVLDKDNNIIEEDHFEYNGPITYCGNGGGSSSDSGASGSDAGWEANDTSAVDEVSLTGGNNPDRSDGDWRDNAQHTYGAPAGPRTDANTMSGSGLGSGPEQVDSDDEYDSPDTQHYRDTQRNINQNIRDLSKEDQYDTSMTNEEYKTFNEDLNKYYGTKDVKYEPYGRAGKGTVNLTFKEHWDNIGKQTPALKYSPTLRFLAASGRNVKEYMTTNYGTGNYAGPGTDSGGLLGGSGNPPRTQQESDSIIMKNIAPEAPYIVSGITKPTNSPAANWYQNLGNSSSTGGNSFNMASEYAAAKAKQQSILGSPTPIGQLAVNDSPFYNWLKERKLDKGIL